MPDFSRNFHSRARTLMESFREDPSMTDDKSNRGPADAQRINVHEDYEVRYWTRELGISEERLREVVARVGGMANDVRAALRRP